MKMKKQKLSLSNLEVKSFVTSLNSSGIKTIQGGFDVVFDSSGATGGSTCPGVPNPTIPPGSMPSCTATTAPHSNHCSLAMSCSAGVPCLTIGIMCP